MRNQGLVIRSVSQPNEGSLVRQAMSRPEAPILKAALKRRMIVCIMSMIDISHGDLDEPPRSSLIATPEVCVCRARTMSQIGPSPSRGALCTPKDAKVKAQRMRAFEWGAVRSRVRNETCM